MNGKLDVESESSFNKAARFTVHTIASNKTIIIEFEEGYFWLLLTLCMYTYTTDEMVHESYFK